MDSVAKIDPQVPQRLDQTSYNSRTIAAPTSPVAGLTSTGHTSTEGSDQLSYVVGAEGLHLVSIGITLLTASNAATSHFVRPEISFTTATGNPAIAGVGIVDSRIGTDIASLIADADGAAIANSHGLDAKGGDLGATSAVTFPIMPQLGSTVMVRFRHTITGACTDGGTYRIGISIIKL